MTFIHLLRTRFETGQTAWLYPKLALLFLFMQSLGVLSLSNHISSQSDTSTVSQKMATCKIIFFFKCVFGAFFVVFTMTGREEKVVERGGNMQQRATGYN